MCVGTAASAHLTDQTMLGVATAAVQTANDDALGVTPMEGYAASDALFVRDPYTLMDDLDHSSAEPTASSGMIPINTSHREVLRESRAEILNEGNPNLAGILDITGDGVEEVFVVVTHVNSTLYSGHSLVILEGVTLDAHYTMTGIGDLDYFWDYIRFANFSAGPNLDCILTFDLSTSVGQGSLVVLLSLNTWESHTYTLNGFWARDAVYDLDQDGFDEQVQYRQTGQYFVIDLAESLDTQTTVSTEGDLGVSMLTVCMGNFTGDAVPDLAFTSVDGVYLIDGLTGAFIKNLTMEEIPLLSFTLDVNADGRDEIIVRTVTSGFITAFDVNSTIHYNNADIEGLGYFHNLHDVDGDGVNDFLANADSSYEFGLISGRNGTTLFESNVLSGLIAGYSSGDYDSDGEIEVLVADYYGLYYMMSQDGTVEASWYYESILIGGPIITYDQDKDLRDDFIMSATFGVALYLADIYAPAFGTLYFTPRTPIPGVLVDLSVEIEDPWDVKNASMRISSDGGTTFQEHVLSPNTDTGRYETQVLAGDQGDLLIELSAIDLLGNSVTLDNDTHYFRIDVRDQVLFTSLDTEVLSHGASADLNGDSVRDAIVSSSESPGTIYFIDGIDGSEFDQFVLEQAAVDIVAGAFNDDAIDDVAVLTPARILIINGASRVVIHNISLSEYSCPAEMVAASINSDDIVDLVIRLEVIGSSFPSVLWIDGLTGAVVRSNERVVDLVNWMAVADFTGDSIDDVVVIGSSTQLVLFDGSTGLRLWTLEDHLVFPRGLGDSLADFSGDGIKDIAVLCVSGPNFGIIFVDVANQEVIGAVEELPADLVALIWAASDVDGDGQDDLIVGDYDGNLYVIDGVNLTLARQIHVGGRFTDLMVDDFNGDGLGDLVVATTRSEFLKIDGLTFQAEYLYRGTQHASGHLFSGDYNEDGRPDIGLCGEGMRVLVDLQPFKTLYLLPDLPTDVHQGELLTLGVEVVDYAGEPVSHSTVAFIAVYGEEIRYYAASETAEGHYSVNTTSGDWVVAPWIILATASHDQYDDITYDQFATAAGDFGRAPLGQIQIAGSIQIEASFMGEIKDLVVVEGDEFELQLLVTDLYGNEYGDVNVTASFAGKHLSLIGSNGHYSVNVTTDGLDFGDKVLEILASGSNFEQTTLSFSIELQPRFPELDVTPAIVFQIIGAVCVSVLFVSLMMRKLYKATRKEENGDATIGRWSMVFLLTMITLSIIALGTVAVFTYTGDYTQALVAIFVAIVALIVTFELRLFRRAFRVDLTRRFPTKGILVDLLFLVPLYSLLALFFYVGGKMAWFQFYITEDYWEFYIIRIPRLIWEVGVVSFFACFLFTVGSHYYTLRSRVKAIKRLAANWEKDFVTDIEQAERAYVNRMKFSRGQLIDLNKSFTLWLLTIGYTTANSLHLLQYTAVIISGVIGAFVAASMALVSKVMPAFKGAKKEDHGY